MTDCKSPFCEAGDRTPVVLTVGDSERAFCDIHCLCEYLIVEVSDTHDVAMESVRMEREAADD